MLIDILFKPTKIRDIIISKKYITSSIASLSYMMGNVSKYSSCNTGHE